MARPGVHNGGLQWASDVIDQSHPLARGVLVAMPFNVPGRGMNATVPDFSGFGRHGTLENTRAFSAGRGGVGAEGFANLDKINLGTGTFLPTAECTVMTFYEKTDATDRSSSIWSAGEVTSANRLRCLGPHSDGGTYFYFGTDSVSFDGLDYSEPVVMICTAGATRGLEIWHSGTLRATLSVTPSRTNHAGVYDLGGGATGGFSNADRNRIYCHIIWDRQLSLGEIQLITKDPFALWRGQRRVFAAPAPATTFTGGSPVPGTKLPGLTGTGVGLAQNTGVDGGSSLPVLTGTGVGLSQNSGVTGGSSLAPLTGTGVGLSRNTGAAFTGDPKPSLPGLTGTGTGLGPPSRTGVTGGNSLAPLTGTGVGLCRNIGADGGGTLPVLTGTGVGTGGLIGTPADSTLRFLIVTASTRVIGLQTVTKPTPAPVYARRHKILQVSGSISGPAKDAWKLT